MRLAIVHDSYIHIGGAEKLLDILIKEFPEIDLYVPLINPNLKKRLEKNVKGKIFSTPLSYIPYLSVVGSIFKPVITLYWKTLNFNQYDLVISSTYSYNSKTINSGNTNHISYIHTPPRYLHGIYNEMTFIHHPLTKILIKPIIDWLKQDDINSTKGINLIIANSKNTHKRIKKVYGRKSIVVYPPIRLSPKVTRKKPEYYLVFSRLVKQKGVELAIRTFNQNKKKLIVVGKGKELTNLKKIAKENIVFKGFLSNEKLEIVFSKTLAMINCAYEEDFGMVNIEAASRGIPLICYYSGGLKESIIEKKTGLFFKKHTVESLSQAIELFEKNKIKPVDCHNFAKSFSESIFRKKMRQIVKYYLE